MLLNIVLCSDLDIFLRFSFQFVFLRQYFRGDKHTYLLTSDRELTTDQSTDTMKIKLCELMTLSWVTYTRRMNEGLFTGTEATQRLK